MREDYSEIFKIDEEGASLFERAVVGSLSPDQQLPYLQKIYGKENVVSTDAASKGMKDDSLEGNFIIAGETGEFLFNPSGFESGDIAEYTKLATSLIGGSLGQLTSVATGFGANPNAQLLAFAAGSQFAEKGFDALVDIQERLDPFITDYINRGGTLEQLNDAAEGALFEIAGGKFVESINFKESLKNAFSTFFSGRFIGAKTREQGQKIVDQASEIGVDTPSLNVALQNPYLEGILRALPFSSQTIRKKAIETQEQLGQSITNLVGDVGLVGGEDIGRFIKTGLLKSRDRLKVRQERLYDKAFSLIPDNTKVSMNFLEELKQSFEKEIASAPESLGPVIAPALKRIQGLIDDGNRLNPNATKQINFLQKEIDELGKRKEGIVLEGRAKTQRDLGIDAEINKKLATIERIRTAPNNKIGLDIETARKIRTQIRQAATTRVSTVGEQIPQNRYMDQVYNTLTKSLKQTTEEIGGGASKAFAKADRFTAGVAEKLAPLYSKVEKLKDEEGVKVFNLLQSGTKEGTGQVKKIMALLDPEEQNIVRRSVLQRMSTKQVKEVGDIVSEEFSPQVFVTAWGKMSPQAKNALFGGKEKQFRSDIEKIVDFSKMFIGSGKELNTSKTSNFTGYAATVLAPMLYSGFNSELIETVALTGVGQLAFAKVVTNPRVVRALVSASEENTPIPVLVGSLIGLASEGDEQDFEAVQAYLTAVASSMIPEAEAVERSQVDIFDVGREGEPPSLKTFDQPETPAEIVDMLESLSPATRDKILNATLN